MGWGTELWDQYDNIGAQTLRGLQFLEKYGDFLKERCHVELEYSKGLRSLCRKYQPKKRDDIDSQFTYGSSFVGILKELNDIAGQHELLSESIREQVVGAVQTTVREIKEQRKMYLDEAKMIQNHLDNTIAVLHQAKRDYGKAWRESEAATFKFYKSDSDMNLSRNDVEKAKIQMSQKARFCEDAKNGYALQLQKANEIQRQHYGEKLPAVFEKLRVMDENRIIQLQHLIIRCVHIDRKILPMIQTCLEEMIVRANEISAEKDSATVVERLRSGYSPPQDIPFEELTSGAVVGDGSAKGDAAVNESPGRYLTDPSSQNSDLASARSNLSNSHRPSFDKLASGPLSSIVNSATHFPRKATMRKTKLGKIISRLGTKSEDCKEDFSDLPPQQRLNRIHQKMELAQNNLNQLTYTREGLLRMRKAYEDNPQFGDFAGVQQELTVNAGAIETQQAEIQKLEIWEKQATAQLNMPINQVVGGAAPPMDPSHSGDFSGNIHCTTGYFSRDQHSSFDRDRSSFSSESLSSQSASEYSLEQPDPPSTTTSALLPPSNSGDSPVPAPRRISANSGAPAPPSIPPPDVPPGDSHNISTNDVTPTLPGAHTSDQTKIESMSVGKSHEGKLGAVSVEKSIAKNVVKSSAQIVGQSRTTEKPSPPPRPKPPNLLPSSGSASPSLSETVTAHLKKSGVILEQSSVIASATTKSNAPGNDTRSARISPSRLGLDVDAEQLYNEPESPVLGTCVVVFDFEGGSEGTVPVTEGEELVILERDEGDGWTRIRHCTQHHREGFVPTSYLECKLYSERLIH